VNTGNSIMGCGWRYCMRPSVATEFGSGAYHDGIVFVIKAGWEVVDWIHLAQDTDQ
jgi:hypothetical protein